MYSAAAVPMPPSILDPSAYIWTEAVFALLCAMVAYLFWVINLLTVGIQDGWKQEGWMVSISPALKLLVCSRIWSGDLNLFIMHEALQIWGWSGRSGGRNSSHNLSMCMWPEAGYMHFSLQSHCLVGSRIIQGVLVWCPEMCMWQIVFKVSLWIEDDVFVWILRCILVT